MALKITGNNTYPTSYATGRPGFEKYMGIVSIDVGLNIYPDVKRTRRNKT